MGNRASNAKAERDLMKGVTFIGEQLRHPAVKDFVSDTAGIMAVSGGNPELAGAMLGQRGAEEGANVINRTLDHNLKYL